MRGRSAVNEDSYQWLPHRHGGLRNHPIGTTRSVILSAMVPDPRGIMPGAGMSSSEDGMVDQPGRRRGSGGGLLGTNRLGALLEIDLRSLALFRIGVAATLLADLASRVRDLEALYGARGVLPPEPARSLLDLRVTISPFTWVAEWTPVLWTVVFVLAAAAVCLALGFVPRSAAALAWFLLGAVASGSWGFLGGQCLRGAIYVTGPEAAR